LSDNLPSEVKFKEASDECSYVNGSISCPPIVLAVGEEEEYEFKVIVVTMPADGRVRNTVSVELDEFDPIDHDNSYMTSTRVLSSGGRPK
jgi:hypothetical protein